MAKDILDFSKFKKIFSDEKNTHLKHPKGHTIIVAHVALSPKMKKQIDSLPMHPEEMIEKAVEMAQDVMEHIPHKAEGGEVPAVNRINMHYKDVTKRIPQLTEGAQKILSGEMGASEYDELVRKHKPVAAYDFVPQPATPEEAMRALNESKRKMYGLTHEMKAGEPADLRLDIPAYKEHGVWVNSIHRKDAPTVYGSVSSVKNAQMVPSSEKALKVAAGGPKAPFAVIRGEWNPMDEGEAVQKAQKYLKHKDWKQVGYDPERHGYFYDRESMRPIIGAEEVIQIGPLVLAKKPTYGKKEEQLFAEGGGVDRPFKGYSSEKHARTGGLNDSYREKYNREHGSNLKRPVTGTPEPGSKDAARKKSFCARMKGVKGPTSEGGELTPKGAALKRWNCHAHGGMIEDDHDEECMHYAKGGRTSALLDKKGNKINKKSERERIFGDDANAPRMSDERMRMMNILRDKVKQEYGVGLRTAAGKRTESGDIRDAGVQPAFDVYTPEGHEAERRYVAEQKAMNPKFKRIDPKPDWNNPDKFMDTQPSPDAGVHEVAHARQIPLGMTLAEHQDAMDALQGQVQKDYGFLQNKRTSHEIQPMAMENPIRRELGFPANSSIATGTAHQYVVNPETLAEHNAGRVSRGQPALETNEEGIPLTHDTKEPMYVAGLDHKGNVVYYMRQSRLMSPENRQRTEDIRQKTVKYHPQRGMVESMSGNALINLRGQGRGEEAERRLRTRGEERFAEGGFVPAMKEHYDEEEPHIRHYAQGSPVGGVGAEDNIIDSDEDVNEVRNAVSDAGTYDVEAPEESPMTPAPSVAPSPSAAPQQQPDIYRNIYEKKLEEARGYRWLDDPADPAGSGPNSALNREQWALNETYKQKKALESQKLQEQQQEQQKAANEQARLRDIHAKKQYFGIPSTAPSAPAGSQQAAPTFTTPTTPTAPSAFGSQGPAEQPMPSSARDDLLGPKDYMLGLNEQVKGIQMQANAAQKSAEAQAPVIKQNIKDQQDLLNNSARSLENLKQYNERIARDYESGRIDPMTAWNDRSVPSKISTAIGLILGGIGGGLTRQENPAMKFLQFQIEKSIEGQKMKASRYDNLLKNNIMATQNYKLGVELTKAQLGEIAVRQMELEANKFAGIMAQGQALEKIGKVRQQLVGGPMMRANLWKLATDPSTSDAQLGSILQQAQGFFPELANDIKAHAVPGYGVADIRPIDERNREIIKSSNIFISNARKLEQLVNEEKAKIAISPFPSKAKADAMVKLKGLAADLARAHGVEPGGEIMKWLDSQLGVPTSIMDSVFLGQTKLGETVKEMQSRKRGALSTGFSPERVEALMRKDEITPPEYTPSPAENSKALKDKYKKP